MRLLMKRLGSTMPICCLPAAVHVNAASDIAGETNLAIQMSSIALCSVGSDSSLC